MRTFIDKRLDHIRSQSYAATHGPDTRLWQNYTYDPSRDTITATAYDWVRPVYFGPLGILSIAPWAKRALLIAHGGYTPRRSIFQTGSGTITVPDKLEILFRAAHDFKAFSRKSSPYDWRTGNIVASAEKGPTSLDALKKEFLAGRIDKERYYKDLLVSEIAPEGSSVTDYRLQCKEDAPPVSPTSNCDIIYIRPNSIAHLHDAFNAYRRLGKKWEMLYFSACRVSRI